ncbi:MAG: hypothetical protein RL701_1767, partial [Pseudomonadota bacterium]
RMVKEGGFSTPDDQETADADTVSTTVAVTTTP